jgi:myo-inositol-1(or 4)-monophosphatase
MSAREFTSAERARAREVARTAARAAGSVLLEYYGRLDPTAIRTKSSERDLVSAADLAAEACLVEVLRRAFPDHAIESEEAVRDADDDRPRWFLDPLDGTVNFVHGLPIFSVSVALYAPHPASGVLQPEVGVVEVPLLGESFHAARGEGAYLGERRLSVSGTTELREAILATGFPYRRNELKHNNLANFNRFFLDVRGIRRFGSAAIDLAYVAAGRFDGYWELHLSPHDLAAGVLLVREAGGVVSDCGGGQAWLREGHLIASNGALHAAIAERVVYRDA